MDIIVKSKGRIYIKFKEHIYLIKIFNIVFGIFLIIIMAVIFRSGIKFGEFIVERVNIGDDLLSFIGAIVGVIGTYGAFIIGKLSENTKEKLKIKREMDLLRNILKYTLKETDLILRSIVEEYIELYKRANLEEILMIRCYEDTTDLPFMIEELITDGLLKEDKRRIKKLERITKEKNSLDYLLRKEDYQNTYYKIHDKFNEINLNKLGYDSNWYNYVLDLPINKKHEKFQYIKAIIDWFVFLQSNNLKQNQEKIERLLEENIKLDVSEQMNANLTPNMLRNVALEVKNNNLKYIMEFIKYRDEVVEVFEKLYKHEDKYDVFEEELIVSYKEFKDVLQYDTWVKKYELEKSELFGDM